MLAGPDPDGMRPQLAALAEQAGCGNRVHWAGMVQGDTKWGAFHAADAFILPSHQENFGIAIAEAIACGLPVLISNKINIWHYVTEDGTGFVEDDTLEGTQKLLQRWLALSAEERQAMVSRTESCFEKRFSMQMCASRIKALVEASKAEIKA